MSTESPAALPYDHYRARWANRLANSRAVDFLIGTRPVTSSVEAKDAKDYLERLQNQLSAEGALINNRLSWNATLQGFLFAGYGVSVLAQNGTGAPRTAISDLQFWLPAVGLGLCVLTLLSIVAAYGQINFLKRLWYQHHASLSPIGPRPLSGPVMSFLGRLLPIGLLVLLMVAWSHLWRIS